MKKSILLFTVALGVLTACNPIKEEKDMALYTISASEIESAVKITQTDADGNPAADGNYFSYTTSPDLNVTIFNYLSDGKENILARGMNGSFSIKPPRGSDPNQTFYVRVVQTDNTCVDISKTYNVYVQQELDPEIRYLASNDYGQKTWKWNVGNANTGGHVWGNFGADGTWRGETLNDFVWWGVDDAAELTGQLGHSVSGTATGEEDNNATMVITDDGLIKCYDAQGSMIRSGTYEVREWTGELNGFRYGILHTSEGATLFPFEINAGGRYVTDYWIYTLTSDNLVLVYPDNGAFSGWSEGTYWNFKSDTDISGMITNYDQKTWTWNVGNTTTSGHVWGNFGADGTWRGDNLSDFIWWGVDDASELTGQLGHSVTGNATGEESNDATMVLSSDGTVKCYDANGTEIRSGTYEIDLSTADGWKLGTFKTSEGAILFPFEINAGGRYVTDYQIWKISDAEMTLTYPDNGAFSGWSEGTYWSFKKK